MSDRIPPGNTEVIVHWNLPRSAGDVQCAFGLNITLTPGMAAEHANIDDAIENLVGPVSDSVTVTRVSYVIGQGGDDITYDRTVDFQGSRATACLPPNCAWLWQKRGGVGGRRGRGRGGRTCPAEPDVDDTGSATPTIAALMVTYADAVLGNIAAADASMVILHQVAPFEPSEVTSLTPQAITASQRGRNR